MDEQITNSPDPTIQLRRSSTHKEPAEISEPQSVNESTTPNDPKPQVLSNSNMVSQGRLDGIETATGRFSAVASEINSVNYKMFKISMVSVMFTSLIVGAVTYGFIEKKLLHPHAEIISSDQKSTRISIHKVKKITSTEADKGTYILELLHE